MEWSLAYCHPLLNACCSYCSSPATSCGFIIATLQHQSKELRYAKSLLKHFDTI